MLRSGASWRKMLATQPPSVVTEDTDGLEREHADPVRPGDLLVRGTVDGETRLALGNIRSSPACKEVTHGDEVRRIVRAKASWM